MSRGPVGLELATVGDAWMVFEGSKLSVFDPSEGIRAGLRGWIGGSISPISVGVSGGRNRRVYLVGLFGYTADVTKRLVEIDDQLLARARTVAGTDTIKATVETALKSLVDQDTSLRHVARLREPGSLDIDRITEARRPRTGTDG